MEQYDVLRRYNVFGMGLFVLLLVLIIQMRLLIYKSRGDIFEGLKETLPYDLSIMGLTLTFANLATVYKFTTDQPFDVRRALFVFPIAMIQLAVTVTIPIIQEGVTRIMIGVCSYLLGYSVFFFSSSFFAVLAIPPRA